MDFSYSEEQQMLQASINKFVHNDYDFDSRQKIITTDKSYSEDHWRMFSELGWLTVPFAEEDGGLGGSAIDIAVVMEAFGKGIVVEPFLATAVLAGGLIANTGNEAQKSTLIPAIIDGQLQLAFAYAEAQSRFNLQDVATKAVKSTDGYSLSGEKSVVLNGGNANTFIVTARTSGEQYDKHGISLFIVDASSAGINRTVYKTVDGQQAADISFDNVTVNNTDRLGEESQAFTAIEAAVDRATLAACAEAVGVMEVAYQKTVEYTKTRQQFGVPIAKFQALQHRMAEMFIEHEQAKSIVLMAAMKLDEGDPEAARAVSAAKSLVSRAAKRIGQEAVQIHGGIGVTEELDVGHYFKRLTTLGFLFGNADFHTRRFASTTR